MTALSEALREHGIRVCMSDDFADCDALLFCVSCHRSLINEYTRRRRAAIQRLDGVYYWQKHGFSTWRRNRDIKASFRASTFKIFQSQYCRTACAEMIGTCHDHECRVILNGIDDKIFFPNTSPSKLRLDKPDFVSVGNFRNADMVAPIIGALDRLAATTGFTYTLVGPVHGSLQPLLRDRPYLTAIESLDRQSLASLLRGSDIFLFSSLNPPCPNAVLEAVACGLPVVSFDDGAMPELLEHQPELLAPAGTGVFRRACDLSVERYVECISHAMLNCGDFCNRAAKKSRSLSIRDTCRNYIDVFVTASAQAASARH